MIAGMVPVASPGVSRTLRISRWLFLIGVVCLDWIASRRAPWWQAGGGDVLIVRLDAIGDFVLWQRSARHYRSLFPQQRLVLAANAAWAGLASRLPYWDEVISIDVPAMRSDLAYRLRLLASLSRRRFAVALHPTHSRSILYGDSVIRTTRAAERIGSTGDLANISITQRRLSDRWYTRLVPTTNEPLAEIDRHVHFLRNLGWQGSDATLRYTAAERLPTVAELPPQLSLDLPYAVVSPAASWTGKQWPASAFAEMIDVMAKECPGRAIVLCGSASERQLCAELATRAHAPTINLAGATTLPELCELIRRADLLIGNDSSAVHIAAAVGTPSVCIVGGGHFGRFVPYPTQAGAAKPVAIHVQMPCFGCNWRCHVPHAEGGPVPCISAITVEAALHAVRQIAPMRAAAPAISSAVPSWSVATTPVRRVDRRVG